MILPLCVTMLVALALLGFALNAAVSGVYLSRPPQGHAAVGLVVPLAGSVLAGLALIAAGLMCGVANRAVVGELLRLPPAAAGAAVPAVSAGVALLAFMVFVLWAEPLAGGAVGRRLRTVMGTAGWVGGIAAPLLLAALLLAAAWAHPVETGARISPGLGSTMRVSAVLAAALAVAGYALGGAGAYAAFGRQVRNRLAAAQADRAQQQEIRAHRAKPQVQRVTDELAAFSAEAPLWSVVAYLAPAPGAERLNNEARAVIIERALRVPDIDGELHATMGARYALYRQGAAELIAHAPQDVVVAHEPAWAAALAHGIGTVAERIACRPAWLSETFDLNPNPVGHVRSLLSAAARFRGSRSYDRIDAALKRLAAATETLTRDSHVNELQKVMTAAGYPLPE